MAKPLLENNISMLNLLRIVKVTKYQDSLVHQLSKSLHCNVSLHAKKKKELNSPVYLCDHLQHQRNVE